METPDVELNGPSGPPAARQNNLFHQLVLRDARVAAIADSPAAWTTRDSRYPVVR